MLVIRLSRTGKKNLPSYRLVVADKRWAVKGKYNDIVGFYNPIAKPKIFSADKEKILDYMKHGAQVSITALNLLCDYEILPKSKKIKIIHAKKKTETETVKNEPKTEVEPAAEAESVSEESVPENEVPTEDAEKPKEEDQE